MAWETDATVTTTRAQENNVDPEAGDDDIAIELSGSWYGYIGQDAAGYYHHMDKRTQTVFITTRDRERFHPDGAGVYWFRVRGPVAQTVCLEDYDDKDLKDWKRFIDVERGWDELPTSVVDKLNDQLEFSGRPGPMIRSR